MSRDEADSSTAAAAVHSAPSVHFQPSAQLMAATESFDDDMVDEQSQQQRLSRSAARRKQARSNGRSAAAADDSQGNNTSPPAPSIKAERAARGAGGMKAQHTDVAHYNSRSHSPPSAHSNSGKKRNNNNKKQAAFDLEDRHHDTPKKRPMRSVDDVLSRIRYEIGSSPRADELMPHFTVAYVDRVWGDQEVPFLTFFESEDLKDVPLHRISYLRYFDEIIWSRAARYDAVFASSNSTKTLPEWIAQTEELRAAQEHRWAVLLAAEAAQAAADQRMLARLDISIAEQRQEIEVMQARSEAASAVSASSGFDFSERGVQERMKEVEEEEEQEEDVAMETESAEAAAPATTATPSTAQTNAAVASPSAPAAASGVVEFGALPPRAPRSTARAGAVSAVVTAAPSSSSAAPPTSAFRGAGSHPLREDDANIAFTVSLLDGSSGLVLRSSLLRVSTAHFDFPFLKKRIASRLHIRSGARDVKRMYLQQPRKLPAGAGAGSSADSDVINVKLTDMNYSTLLTDGCDVVVMAEVDARKDPAALLLQQSPLGAGERMQDEASIQAQHRAPAATTSAPRAPAATSGTAPASAPARRSERPNYFVSLRISNPSVLASLHAVQDALVAHESRYAPFLVPKGTFHLTLSLLCIASDAEADTALRVLQESVPRVKELLYAEPTQQAQPQQASPSSSSNDTLSAPLSLTFRGMSSFGDRVVYADVVRDESRARLNRVALLLSAAFDEAGVGCIANYRSAPKTKSNQQQQRGDRGAMAGSKDVAAAVRAASSGQQHAGAGEVEAFTPHLTIAKMSRAGPQSNRKDKHKNKNQAAHQPRAQVQNTGVEELADERDADAAASDLPLRPNSFLALSRGPSTASTTSAVSCATDGGDVDESMEEAAGPSSGTAVGQPNASTSVVRRIDSVSYVSFVHHSFGAQSIVELDLCSMQARKQADGYYATKGSVNVAKGAGVEIPIK